MTKKAQEKFRDLLRKNSKNSQSMIPHTIAVCYVVAKYVGRNGVEYADNTFNEKVSEFLKDNKET